MLMADWYVSLKKRERKFNMETASLKKDYKERIVPALVKEFGYTTTMQVPKLEKIVLNQGLGSAVADRR